MTAKYPNKVAQAQTGARLITHLGCAEVAKGEPVVWPGFRMFLPVPEQSDTTATRAKRRLNTLANPVFDYTRDTLFDYPTICAHKAQATDWRLYNRLCSAQVDRCPFRCWHCYNDAWPDPAKGISAGPVQASDIFASFLEQRDFDLKRGKHTNVLRMTGGEPFCEAPLILELVRLVAARNAERHPEPPAIVWTETNLVPFADDSPCAVLDRDNYLHILADHGQCLAVHPCFHGLSDAEILAITGSTVPFVDLVTAFRRLFDAGIDLYPTIHANISHPRNLASFFEVLYDLHPNLPLRVALVEVDLTYSAVRKRMEQCRDDGRVLGITSKHASLYQWNRLVEAVYGFGYAAIPRHLVPLEPGTSFAKSSRSSSEHLPQTTFDVSSTQLLLLKSSDRDAYRQLALTVLGLPEDFVLKVEYDARWVSQDLAEIAERRPDRTEQIIGIPTSICYAERGGDEPAIYPMRTGSTEAVIRRGDTVSFVYKLNTYPKAASHPDAVPNGGVRTAPNLTPDLWEVFGERTLAPSGPLYATLSPGAPILTPASNSGDAREVGWQRIVKSLSSLPRLRLAAFCRLGVSDHHRIKTEGAPPACRSLIRAAGGDVVHLTLEYLVPNLGEIQSTPDAPPTMCVQVTNPDIVKPVGPQEVVLSKYGTADLRFKCGVPDRPTEAEVLIWRKDAPTLGPYFRIPIRVTSTAAVIGNLLSSIVTVLIAGLGTFGVASLSRSDPDTFYRCIAVTVALVLVRLLIHARLLPGLPRAGP